MPRPTAWRKVGQQKSGKKIYFSDESSLSSIPSAADIWTHGSPRRQSNLEVEKIIVWGYIQYGGAREICKVDGNIGSAQISCLPDLTTKSDPSCSWECTGSPSTFPNYKRGPFWTHGSPRRQWLFCRPKEPIQDINYLTFSPWWNTRLIFPLLFYLLF